MLPTPRSDVASGARWRPAGTCEVCRRWTRGGLCSDCLHHFAPRVARCRRCALALSGGAERCGECLRDPPPFRQTVCLADYGFPWDHLIARLKFHQRPEMVGPLAEGLARAAAASDLPLPHAFVAVPLTGERLAERGYNQAWQMARRLARETGSTALPRALERRFDHPPQASLDRAQRLANLRGAFVVPAREVVRVRGRHLALVDDVMTTGATARAAAAALVDAGAVSVDLWVVARTPAR